MTTLYFVRYHHTLIRTHARHFLTQETLDEWQACQRTWMYLESIFGSPDIVRQLPAAAKMFQAVDKSWRHIMVVTADEPLAIKQVRDQMLLHTPRGRAAYPSRAILSVKIRVSCSFMAVSKRSLYFRPEWHTGREGVCTFRVEAFFNSVSDFLD